MSFHSAWATVRDLIKPLWWWDSLQDTDSSRDRHTVAKTNLRAPGRQNVMNTWESNQGQGSGSSEKTTPLPQACLYEASVSLKFILFMAGGCRWWEMTCEIPQGLGFSQGPRDRQCEVVRYSPNLHSACDSLWTIIPSIPHKPRAVRS